MSFRSRKEARYCYWLKGQARKKGEELSWDCDAYSKRTDFSTLPYEVGRKDSPKVKRGPGRPPKIHIGPRGGRYYMHKGKKVYVKDFYDRGSKTNKK